MAQGSKLIQAKQYNHQSNNPPPSMTSPPSLPGVVPCTPSKIVHGIDDSMQDVVVVAGREPPRGRKQYMTHSMVAATEKLVSMRRLMLLFSVKAVVLQRFGLWQAIGFRASMRVQFPLLLPYDSIWILMIIYVVLFWFYSISVCGFNTISREHVPFVT